MDGLLGIFELALVASAIRLVTPILLAALGGMLNERVGIFNIALEGLMLVGAFFAVLGTHTTGQPIGGLAFALAATTAVALVFGVFVIDFRANAIVAGLATNILALGLTTYGMRLAFGVTGGFYDPALNGLPNIDLPLLGGIPVVGELVSGYSPLVYIAWLAVPLLYLFLFRHPLGLRSRAVGEDPVAAASIGIRVRRLRYLSMVLCGVLCGLAGAQLSISLVTQFVEGMTAGRGFIALVAVMFGRAHPFGVFGAATLFGFFYAVTLRMQGIGIPNQFVSMVPYVVTIVALIYIFRREGRKVRARSAVEAEGTQRESSGTSPSASPRAT